MEEFTSKSWKQVLLKVGLSSIVRKEPSASKVGSSPRQKFGTEVSSDVQEPRKKSLIFSASGEIGESTEVESRIFSKQTGRKEGKLSLRNVRCPR
jgi:hypothetical protein